MDYFSELLESYSQLKKRTYKITYLNEAYAYSSAQLSAFKDIDSAIQAAAEGEEQTGLGKNGNMSVTPVEGKPNSVKIEGGNAGSKIVNAGSYKNDINPNKTHKKSYSVKLLGAWSPKGEEGEGGSGSTEDMERDAEITKAQEKLAQEESNRTIEGSVEGTEYQGMGTILAKGFSKIKELISNQIIDMSDSVALAQFTLGNYDTLRGGFIKQILQGEVRKLNADGKKSVKGGKVSVAQAESMAKKFNILATSPGIEKGSEEAKKFCQKVSNEDSPLIGMYKNKPVIYGADKTESLVFPTVNKILDGALNQIEKLCGKTRDSLKQVPSDSVASQGLNGIRGTFFEDITVFVINIKAAKTQEERKAVGEEFKKLIREKRGDLEKIVAAYGGDDAATLDLELFAESEYQKDLFEILNSAPAFRDYLYRELSLVNDFVDDLGASRAERTGGGKAAGGERDDIIAVFDTEDAARAAGKKLKIEPYQVDGEWKVSIGSKRYLSSTDGKLGEVNSDDQLIKNMDPTFAGNSNYNAEGMRDRVLTELYGWDGKESSREEALGRWQESFDYYKGIQDNVDKLKSSFIDTEVYAMNGKVSLETPKARADNLLNKLKAKTGYSDLAASPLQDVLYTTNADGELELIDLEDISARERLAEKVARLYKMQQLEKGLSSEQDSEKAKNAAMLMAYSTGGNIRDMSQVFSTDDYSIAFSQTGLLKSLAGSKDTKVEINGFTIKISDGKRKIKVGLERAGKNTRTVCKTDEASMKMEGKFYNPKKEEGASTEEALEHILRGQINLLETLLNQTNGNLLP
ncbi:MAG: hypothetical protein CMJ25_03005 [Phycisphaerae bacterium]|nr:hypothetical protein [Phycisphaerae bacterium]